MATKLRALKIGEISLVDRPANPGARVVLAKRKFSADAFKRGDSMLAKFLKLFVKGEMQTAADALGVSVKSILEDPDAKDKAALVDETLKQFTDHVEAIVPDEVEKALAAGLTVDSSDEDTMSAELKKALGLPGAATDVEVTAAIAKLQADAAKTVKLEADLEIAKAGMGDDELAYHAALKSDDECKAFRALAKADRVAKAKASKAAELPEDIRKALAEAEDVKKRLAALEDDKALAGFTKRAVSLGLAEADGEMLMKASKGDAEAFKKVEALIAGLTKQVSTGVVFKEFGTSRGGDTGAREQLDAKAAELRKTESSLTKEQAFSKVYTDPANKDLVKAYKQEQRTQTRAA